MLTPIAPPNHWPYRVITSTSYTLAGGDAVLHCENTNNLSITLPTTGELSGQIFCVRKESDNAATVAVGSLLTLYLAGDAVWFQGVGTGFKVLSDLCQPHSCTMSRTSNESLGTGGVKVHLDTVDRDNAGLADLSNNRIVVRRLAEYHINSFGAINGSTQIVQAQIYVNGSLVKTGAATLASQTAGLSLGYHKMFLSADDYVELYLNHTVVGGAVPPTNHNRPWLSVTEVR